MESTNTNNKIKEVRELFSEVRSNLSSEETKRIREELYKKEAIYNFSNKKDGLIDKEKAVLKNIAKYLKKLHNNLKKLRKYQDNIAYGLDDLLNELNEEDYSEPKEIKKVFNGSHIVYESRGDKDAKLALWEYFDKIRPYLRDMIDYYKAEGEWKIQLVMGIIFISFIDKNETQVMHTKSDNVEIMNGTDTSDAINKLINSFMKRYQEGLETKMKGSSYIFEHIDLLEYHLHKISLNRGSSYIKSFALITNKGVTLNPKNTKDNKCFQYAIIAALKYNVIDHHPERISKLKPFINEYNCKDIEFPSHLKDWKKFERNNKTIALNILYVPYNAKHINNENDNENGNYYDDTKEIRIACKSKYNNIRDTQVVLLMITNGNSNWHYLAVKNISGLLRGITSNHNGDFSCLTCFRSYTTEMKLRKHKRICENHDFCFLKMPDEDKILEYVPRKKSLKVPFIIYTDLECLLKKTKYVSK